MKNSLLPSLCVLACTPALTSCTMTGKRYVDQSVGCSVTRGELVRVANLHTVKAQHLRDGIAITVAPPGCEVSLRFGEQQVQSILAKPGCILVLSLGGDYVLQPYTDPGPGTPPGQKSPGTAPPTPAK